MSLEYWRMTDKDLEMYNSLPFESKRWVHNLARLGLNSENAMKHIPGQITHSHFIVHLLRFSRYRKHFKDNT